MSAPDKTPYLDMARDLYHIATGSTPPLGPDRVITDQMAQYIANWLHGREEDKEPWMTDQTRRWVRAWAARQVRIYEQVMAEDNEHASMGSTMRTDLAFNRTVLALCDEVDDWREGARKVMAEVCAPDEKHCTCVPALRKHIAALESRIQDNTNLIERNRTLETRCRLLEAEVERLRDARP